jgi:hypothetical protein
MECVDVVSLFVAGREAMVQMIKRVKNGSPDHDEEKRGTEGSSE